ncbi:DNA repair exonuclease [Candidatus Micrarchaeota archaeon]|nr:DNA repair exonuclease [Candidatus Micrarchaeota archaeon]
MKIAIFSDPHLGYARFEEDSYVQAENAIVDASTKADLIICAGDIFDIRIPKLETLKRAIDIFKKASVPIIAIHGNHERRTKELVNPAQILAASTGIILLHGETFDFEKNNEKVQFFGLGSIPEDYVVPALKKTLERFVPDTKAFKIIILHQSIKELLPADSTEELSLEYLETLPFDLIVNGHIHEQVVKLNGRFIIPGSTVITQLKKDQMLPRGYFLYDTISRTSQFIPIACRKFFYEELVFDQASPSDVDSAISSKVSELRLTFPNCIISMKLNGTLRSGVSGSDFTLSKYPDVFIDNNLDSQALAAKLEKIQVLRNQSLSVRDLALSELSKRTSNRLTLFSPSDLFDNLSEGPDEAMSYLESTNKNRSKQS